MRHIFMWTVATMVLLGASHCLADESDDGEWDVVNQDDGWDVVEGEDTPDQSDEFESADQATGVLLHGILENQLMAMWPKQYNGEERVYVNDYVRLRVDLDVDLPKGIKIRTDGVARLFVGETEYYMVNLIPRKTFDQLVARDPRWAATIGDKYALENELYLDNAYMILPVGTALITVGKQPLEQGAGYAWNPTDVFSDKDIFDPSYEKEGIVALRLVLPFADFASLDLVGAPDGKLEHWKYGGRFTARAGPLSFSAASFVTRVRRTDLEGSMDAMAAAALMGQDPEDAISVARGRRVMVGGDAVLDVAGVRLWTEGAYNFVEDVEGAPENWWEVVGGAEYFFPFETHLMAEYHHYGAGPLQTGGVYDYNAWMQILAAELNMLGRDFLFESVDHPVADFWTIGISSFQSLSDASAVIMADVRWEFVQDAQLWILLAASIGDDEDFFSSSRGQGWARVTVHF